MTQNNKKLFVSHYETKDIPDQYTLILIKELDNIPDNSIDEIFIKECIGVYSDANLGTFIKVLVNKLTNHGQLYIQDIDIEQLSVYLSNRTLPITQKNLLYKAGRSNVFYMRFIVRILQSIPGISINQLSFINGYEFFIRTEKNA